jgi:hypothetical protein
MKDEIVEKNSRYEKYEEIIVEESTDSFDMVLQQIKIILKEMNLLCDIQQYKDDNTIVICDNVIVQKELNNWIVSHSLSMTALFDDDFHETIEVGHEKKSLKVAKLVAKTLFSLKLQKIIDKKSDEQFVQQLSNLDQGL